jgi:hypothetical protein
MLSRNDLIDLVFAAIKASGGQASIVDVAKHIWANNEDKLRNSGNLFYTWQYDIRWAALKLRRSGRLNGVDATDRGIWMLK